MADENEETTTSEQEEGTQETEQSRTAKNTVAVEDVGPCKKKVTIEVPEETIKEAADEQYRELRKDAVLPGSAALDISRSWSRRTAKRSESPA